MEELKDLILQVDNAKHRPNNAVILSLLKLLRKSKARRSDLVLKYGHDLLKSGSVGADVWLVSEQVLVAALDVGNLARADECLSSLEKKFPTSSRVMRLKGMRHEAAGEFAEAMKIYDKLLETNPANLLVLKRKVCVYRAQGDVAAAATELHGIIQMFPDSSSWQELGELHLSQSDYAAAAHCFEDFILLEPNNAHAHTRLADCYYTLGGYENFVRARKHYSISLTFQSPNSNLRALYGLVSACKAAAEESTSSAQPAASAASKNEKAVNAELLKWACEHIHEAARHSGSATAAAVARVIAE